MTIKTGTIVTGMPGCTVTGGRGVSLGPHPEHSEYTLVEWSPHHISKERTNCLRDANDPSNNRWQHEHINRKLMLALNTWSEAKSHAKEHLIDIIDDDVHRKMDELGIQFIPGRE